VPLPVRDVLVRERKRSQPHRPLTVGVAAGDGEPTPYREWIGAVAEHFGAKTVGDPAFELPRSWEFESWRSRRVLGDLEAETA
jgi:hypothetical protein